VPEVIYYFSEHTAPQNPSAVASTLQNDSRDLFQKPTRNFASSPKNKIDCPDDLASLVKVGVHDIELSRAPGVVGWNNTYADTVLVIVMFSFQ
jgi:hypothetical protein